MKSFVHSLNRILYILSALLILLVTLMIISDVVGRGVFNAPLTGTVETVSNIIVVIAFLQVSYSIQTGGMFHSTILLDVLPAPARRLLVALGELTGAAVFLCMVYASWEPTLHAWKIGEYYGGGDFRFPVYPVRSVLVFCCGLAAVNYLLRALAAILGETPDDDTVEV
ncbi:TRAP transporter small permease [Marinovum algicola]|uniref:TRAP transporter small permease n=1 Tax=Marinovum algicola TaxID=42444 RepID=UPI0032EE85F7